MPQCGQGVSSPRGSPQTGQAGFFTLVPASGISTSSSVPAGFSAISISFGRRAPAVAGSAPVEHRRASAARLQWPRDGVGGAFIRGSLAGTSERPASTWLKSSQRFHFPRPGSGGSIMSGVTHVNLAYETTGLEPDAPMGWRARSGRGLARDDEGGSSRGSCSGSSIAISSGPITLTVTSAQESWAMLPVPQAGRAHRARSTHADRDRPRCDVLLH